MKKKTTVQSKPKSKNGEVRHATVKDAAQIQNIVNYYAKKDLILARSLNEIYENIRDFAVIEKKGKIIACGALHICWDDLAEIKSLAVTPRNKRKGCGGKIVQYLFHDAEALGIPRVFALTYQVEFFSSLGFRRIEMESLPKKIWADCIKCVRFANCNEVAMTIDL